MNTNTKYYTPAIEELHIGFECQRVNQDLLGSSVLKNIENNSFTGEEPELNPDDFFSDHIINYVDIQFFDLNPHLLQELRVKHLDREDIESLGWIQRDYDTFDFGSNIAFEFIPEEISYIYTYGGGKNPDTIFKGKIKNKSELQKLMVQLKIKE